MDTGSVELPRKRRLAPEVPRASVTLRGIVVEHVWPEARLLLWTDVEFVTSEGAPMLLFEPDGRPLRAPTGRLVRLRLENLYERSIAIRAQLRYYLRAWDTGVLQFGWVNPRPRWEPILCGTIGLGLLVGTAVLTGCVVRYFVSSIGWLPHLPRSTALWAVALLAFLALLAVPMRGLIWMLVRDLRSGTRGNVEGITITREGIVAALTDGREIAAPWEHAVHLTATAMMARIVLLDGVELRLPADRRLLRVLSLVREKVLPRLVEEQRRSMRRSRVLLALVVTGSVGFGVAVSLSPIATTGQPLGMLGAVLLATIGMPAAFGLIFCLQVWISRLRIRRARATRVRNGRARAGGRTR